MGLVGLHKACIAALVRFRVSTCEDISFDSGGGSSPCGGRRGKRVNMDAVASKLQSRGSVAIAVSMSEGVPTGLSYRPLTWILININYREGLRSKPGNLGSNPAVGLTGEWIPLGIW